MKLDKQTDLKIKIIKPYFIKFQKKKKNRKKQKRGTPRLRFEQKDGFNPSS